MKIVPSLSLADLPSPPGGQVGWPWTKAGKPFPQKRGDGTPWPSIRIVTPSYNQGEYIEETIRSVLLQGYPNLEYFIVDGGSTDGTLEVIDKYQGWLSGWISEPDRGQVHAIKKGLAGTATQYFTWINSDDTYEKNALKILDLARDGYAIAGAVSNKREDKVLEIKKNSKLNFKDYTKRGSPSIFHQPGVFWPNTKTLISSLDEELHYTFDVKVLLSYLLEKSHVECVDHKVAVFRLHENSKTISQPLRFQIERVKVFDDIICSSQGKLRRDLMIEMEKRYWSEFLRLKLLDPESRAISEIIQQIKIRPNRFNREALGALRRLIVQSGWK
ncbi:glycosyltransferase [Ovoidimarina sediminis]|uniref:glycosyltransferase n=1 Tax=Ovoidimarina sediminis TaxID=3079856 RepID=UPI002912A308|nr:glycosyltransferase [Rhodophyticola sp. MJ-SS7]MDU8946155.1 glycosyltransferase [Rhodophyticola sp. MJ-SS7]